MKHIFSVVLVILMMTVVTAEAIAEDSAGGRARRAERGRLVERQLVVDGLERTYRVLAPRSSKALPLVLVLHGGGFGNRGAMHVISYTELDTLAGQKRFIVGYPIGVEGNWNDGRNVSFIAAQRDRIDDVKFIRRVVDDIEQDYKIDRTRIFSTGISNGAMMCHRLAAEASDMIAAIAPVVGGMPPKVADKFAPAHPVSLLIIQGDSDPLVPIAGGEVGFRFARKRGRVIPTTETIAKYVQLNKIQGEPKVTMLKDRDQDDGAATQTTIYPVARNGSKVQLYVVKNGGHTWPGKPQYLREGIVGRTCQDFDASRVIWDFFQSCPPRR